MKFNRKIVVGILLILLAVFIFFSDALNGIIRPITHIFLMGSSKGKDVLFFGIFGLCLILSQLYNIAITRKFINKNKINYYLKIVIILSFILAISGIALEVVLRMSMNIDLNTVFVALKPDMTSTSILHSHIYKSVLGEIVYSTFNSLVSSNIHLGNSLFPYIPKIAILLVVLFPIIFIYLILSLQKRSLLITALLSFFGTCALIGILDGGLFSVPAILGLCGMILLYRNEYYFNYVAMKLLKRNKTKGIPPKYEKYLVSKKCFRYFLNRFLPYLVVIIIIFLRLSITIIGANTEYYDVNIKNLEENIDFSSEYKTLKIIESENNTELIISPNYNEMVLLNRIALEVKEKADYMTMSWNGFSYF
ncbi:hypothetical protein [Methanobrevibacter sp. DSM 116169]|uniref:hypothetical protein n=1 Tax=Methanobrevibacter sp. DSM 116169 TaxID=3242727 RepID=UPI0038FC9490